MEIVNKKVIDLVPYANNSRTHTEHQISQIANSIKKFGFTLFISDYYQFFWQLEILIRQRQG
jgi:hypothetical protein